MTLVQLIDIVDLVRHPYSNQEIIIINGLVSTALCQRRAWKLGEVTMNALILQS